MEAEQSIADMSRSSDDAAIITLDSRGFIIAANEAAELLFGYASGDLVGTSGVELFSGDSNERREWLDIIDRQDVICRRSDLSTFAAQVTWCGFESKSCQYMTAVFRNISETQQRLAELEAILKNAVDAIIRINDRGIVRALNPATERVFGYAASEVLGQNISMLMPDPYRHEHDGYLHNYRETGLRKIIGIGREVLGRRKNGSVFPMHLAVSEIVTGDDRFFIGIVRDISDLKLAESELKRLNEGLEQTVRARTAALEEAQAALLRKERLATLGQVSGGIAHEIRNPLNAVKTSAYYLLNARNPTPEKTVEHLQRIDRQVTMIDNVITALTDVARLPQPYLKPLAIAPIIEQVLRESSLPSSIQVSLQIPPDLPKVQADENQLPIVFKNLVRNARDAMPEGGTLTISAKATENGRVTIDVQDSGSGIAPERIPLIMEPLYSTKARGMGLGLAISLAIVQKNQGKIWVQSRLGSGTMFSVELQASVDAD